MCISSVPSISGEIRALILIYRIYILSVLNVDRKRDLRQQKKFVLLFEILELNMSWNPDLIQVM